jgi:hypothetical protein
MKLGVALLITPMFMPPNQMNIIQSGALLPAPFAEVSARLPALGLFRIEFTLGANDHALRLFVQRFGIDGDEPPRVYRRLQILEDWSDEQSKSIFPRGQGTRSAHGGRT